MSTVVAIVLVVTTIINALLLIILFGQTIRTLFHRLFLLHLVGTLGWTLSILVFLEKETALASQLSFAFALILAAAKYYFVKVFPENPPSKTLWFYAPLVPFSILLILCFAPNLYYTEVMVVDGFYITSTPGPLAGAYVLGVIYFLVAPIWELGKKVLSGRYHGLVQAQLRVLLYGITIFFLAAFLTNSLLPVLLNIYYFNGFGPVLSLILTAFIIHNIYRYRFLEVQLIIQRGLIYLFLFTLVVFFYLSSVTVIGLMLHTTLHITHLTAGAITTVIGIFTVPVIDHFLRRVTHPLFFKGQFDYSETLHDLSQTLHKTLHVQKIVEATTSKLETIFGASKVVILLGRQPAIDYAEHVLAFELNTDSQQTGVLLLGAKKSGDEYTKRDRQMVSTLVHQVAVAIERAQLYEEVRHYNEQLEAKVAARTRELEALQHYQRQMLDELSHGLQIPLTTINNELENIDLQQGLHLHPFREAVNSLTVFIQKLLQLSKLEAPDNHWPMVRLNISTLLEEIIEYSTVSLSQVEIECQSEIEPQVFIKGDKQKLTEAILVLLHNAMKYRHPDRPQSVRVTLARKADSAIIEVRDTGLGIAKQYQPHIFKRFYRVRDGTHRRVSGSGLGLAITSAIIHKHGGSITVSSEVGQYTNFTITLPLG